MIIQFNSIYLHHQTNKQMSNQNINEMKTLKLIAKANGRNYFFGEINAKGQELTAEFTSPEEMQKFLTERRTDLNAYVNLPFCKEIINAEYSQSRTYYNRFNFNSLDFCKKVFEKRAK